MNEQVIEPRKLKREEVNLPRSLPAGYVLSQGPGEEVGTQHLHRDPLHRRRRRREGVRSPQPQLQTEDLAAVVFQI